MDENFGFAESGMTGHAGQAEPPFRSEEATKRYILECRGLVKSYGNMVALHGIDLRIEEGGIV